MIRVYNEIDPNAAQWLRELIKLKQIPDGDVDERSIVDFAAGDVRNVTQFHAFAGIGVWAYALRLAGWSDDRPVWTGSCPCQPFSSAGGRAGTADERHLWPAWHRLIRACRPDVVFGEQVASADAIGKVSGKLTNPDGWRWLDFVQADMEDAHYAFGASAFTASSVGAPHIRQRLYFVGMADASSTGLEERAGSSCAAPRAEQRPQRLHHAGRMADSQRTSTTDSPWTTADWLFCRDGKWRPVEPGTFPLVDGSPGNVVPSGDLGAPTQEARAMRLKGYGNAIVAQQAETFIRAAMMEIDR